MFHLITSYLRNIPVKYQTDNRMAYLKSARFNFASGNQQILGYFGSDCTKPKADLQYDLQGNQTGPKGLLMRI